MNNNPFIHRLIFLPIILLASCSGNLVSTSNSSQIYYDEFSFDNNLTCHLFGRAKLQNKNLNLFFSGTGFETNVIASNINNSFSICCSGLTIDNQKSYVSLFLDNEIYLNMVPIEQDTIISFNKLSLGNHTLKVLKETEVGYSNILLSSPSYTGIKFRSINPNDYSLKIGFFGDSITCGYGNLSTSKHSFQTSTECLTKTYGYLTCTSLKSDFQFVCRSGAGFSFVTEPLKISSFVNTYNGVDYYDSSLDKLNLAVINLGTNDAFEFDNYDPILQKEIINQFSIDSENLVNQILSNNPQCKIIFVVNMMNSLNDMLKDKLNNHCSSINKKKGQTVLYLLEMTPNNKGADNHPSLQGHEESASKLTYFIQNNIIEYN